MKEIIVIKIMNEAMIKLKESKHEDCSVNKTIQHHLEADEDLFFKISKNNALQILTNVGVADDKLEETYRKLMEQKNQ
ncbi:MAG: hypothetical protein IJ890_08910 [Clostridia bacterium]|nr:hypothetical protein [Clostridia bacterium]